MPPPTPVIDLFAGPGGLGEGFSAYPRDRDPAFDIRLSIEKDPQAHQTLELRSFFRQFPRDSIPEQYYDFLRATDVPLPTRRKELFDFFPVQAKAAEREAWNATLGEEDPAEVRSRISRALGDSPNWVLLGGPPCQAYSLVGRSRNRGNEDYRAEDDHRQFLYREYLQVLADHRPALFVMENVKGLLSATVKNQRMFERILDDLKSPATAVLPENGRAQPRPRSAPAKYRLFSIVQHGLFDDLELRDFVVPMELYGIPQARHRVIVIGVREDLADVTPGTLRKQDPVSVRQIISGLPRLRSGLSREADDAETWIDRLRDAESQNWFSAGSNGNGNGVHRRLQSALGRLRRPRNDRGSEFVPGDVSVDYEPDWYLDERIEGACNHSTRGHIVPDLWRYLYVACFAEAHDRSPTLKDFHRDLLPDHRNVSEAMNGSAFADRFRVQLYGGPSTTVTSHIAKDGHYYIHPDPTQCRSLTVREAARLQTFPDNYFFCGPRTSQYGQVGNAVPPLLAFQIAEIVHKLLVSTGVIA